MRIEFPTSHKYQFDFNLSIRCEPIPHQRFRANFRCRRFIPRKNNIFPSCRLNNQIQFSDKFNRSATGLAMKKNSATSPNKEPQNNLTEKKKTTVGELYKLKFGVTYLYTIGFRTNQLMRTRTGGGSEHYNRLLLVVLWVFLRCLDPPARPGAAKFWVGDWIIVAPVKVFHNEGDVTGSTEQLSFILGHLLGFSWEWFLFKIS